MMLEAGLVGARFAHFAYAAWRLCSLFKMNAGTFGCDNG